MKTRILCSMTITAVAVLFMGCAMHPEPVLNANAAPISEPIHFPIIWGDNELFEEKNAPLAVRVVPSVASQENKLSEHLKARLNNAYIRSVESNEPWDMQINVNSEFKQIAPAPQLRMYHLLEIGITTPDGLPLFPTWGHKSEVAEAYSEEEACRNKLLYSATRGIDNWMKNIFKTGNGQAFRVSVLRFRITHYLIDFNFARMETEQRKLLNQLRKINGVCNVRIIESNYKNKIVSFRVLYRRNQLPYGVARVIKK